MTLPFATVDLTRQRLGLSSTIFGSATEAWAQDVTIKALALEGVLDVSFETVEPTNYRRLWYDFGNPPTGMPGVLKIWDADIEQWVKLTPTLYRTYVLTAGRPYIWYTSKLAVGTTRPPEAELLVGDLWEHDTTTDNELSMYRQLGPNNRAWVDLTGGGVDPSTITKFSRKFTIMKPGDAWPVEPKYDDAAYVTQTSTLYTWLPNPDRWEDIAQAGGGGGVASSSIAPAGPTPPINPTVGMDWYNTTADRWFRWTSNGVNQYWFDLTG